MGDLLDRYVIHAETVKGRSPTTVAKYRYIATQTITDDLRRVKLSKLTPGHLNRFYASMRAKGNKDATVRRAHALLSASLRYGERNRLIGRHNIAKDADPPDVAPSKIAVPESAQVHGIIAAAHTVDPMFADMFELASLTGCRRGELCGLRWSDWNRKTRTLTVEQTVYDKPGGWGIKGPKNDEPRTVPVSPQALRVLNRRWKAAAKAAGADPVGFMFTADETGTEPTRPDWVSKRFATAAAKSGANVTLHSFRHWAGSQMIGAGVDPATVAEILGHDPAVLVRVYAHTSKERKAQATAALGRKFANAGKLASGQ